MKNKLFFRILFTLLLFVFLFTLPISSITAHADMGPKPSIHITFKNLQREPCYATLLSKKSSTGPYGVWSGNEEELEYRCNIDNPTVWKKFIEYEDADGFYFLQWARKLDTNTLAWTYYPPTTFKVLLYYPQTDTFLTSDIYERYAFDSYFTVDARAPANGKLSVRESYDYTQEIIGLLARIILTIAVEILIGWLIGFRSKRDLLFLIGLNYLTQIVLNVFLNIALYQSGELVFLFVLMVAELIVFTIEIILCGFVLRTISKSTIWSGWYFLYPFVANFVSFILGLAIAGRLPLIF